MNEMTKTIPASIEDKEEWLKYRYWKFGEDMTSQNTLAPVNARSKPYIARASFVL